MEDSVDRFVRLLVTERKSPPGAETAAWVREIRRQDGGFDGEVRAPPQDRQEDRQVQVVARGSGGFSVQPRRRLGRLRSSGADRLATSLLAQSLNNDEAVRPPALLVDGHSPPRLSTAPAPSRSGLGPGPARCPCARRRVKTTESLAPSHDLDRTSSISRLAGTQGRTVFQLPSTPR